MHTKNYDLNSVLRYVWRLRYSIFCNQMSLSITIVCCQFRLLRQDELRVQDLCIYGVIRSGQSSGQCDSWPPEWPDRVSSGGIRGAKSPWSVTMPRRSRSSADRSFVALWRWSFDHRRQRRSDGGDVPLQYFNWGMLCVIFPQSFIDFVVRALTNTEQNGI